MKKKRVARIRNIKTNIAQVCPGVTVTGVEATGVEETGAVVEATGAEATGAEATGAEAVRGRGAAGVTGALTSRCLMCFVIRAWGWTCAVWIAIDTAA